MKLNFFIYLSLLPLFLFSQEKDEVIDRLSGKLASWQQQFPADKIYLQTDKEVYAPGEIIWFSGMILNRSSNELAVYYPDLAVALFDAAGNALAADKFPVTGGKVNGDFLLPEQLPLGDYYLAAFTLYQEEPDNLFVKPLVINRYYKSDARVSLVLPGKVYTAGIKNDIELKVTDVSGNPADRFNLNYEIRHKGVKQEEGKIKSSAGRAVFQALLPAATGKEPVELMISHPKNLWKQSYFLRTSADELSVVFYPEGGHLVGGHPQKTGFFASAWNNSPVDLEAEIVTSSGQLVSRVKTFHPGFGMFSLQPTPGEKVRFVVTSPYGKGQSFDLPAVDEEKPAVVVSQSDAEHISADLLVKGNQKLTLAVTRGYQILWAASLDIADKARVKIPVNDLGSGIVRLTLFNSRTEALSSRLVYLPEKNPATLEIGDAVAGDGKLKLTLTTKEANGEAVPAKLTVAVSDIRRKLPASQTLKGSSLLNGDLYHQADLSVFNPEEAARESRIFDFLMISNQLKAFSWDEVLETKATETPLSGQTGLSGKVTDKRGNPIPFAQVKIMDNRDMKIYTSLADGNGLFRYEEYQPLDISRCTLSATDKEGNGSYQVQANPTLVKKVSSRIKQLYSSPFDPTGAAETLPVYLKNNPEQLVDPPSGKLQQTADKQPKVEHYKTMLASASSLPDVIRSIKPYTIMNGQIVFGGMVNSINFQSGALIVIDGVKMGTSIDILNSLSPSDVEEINISTDPMDIQRYTGLNNVGIIEIVTKKGQMTAPATEEPEQKEELYKEGIRIPRNFLSSDAMKGQQGKDFRTTLYWNPGLDTGTAGTITFSVPLSEIKSGFVITAEGMTSSGKIVRAEKEFLVP